jgi:hypothetical protein
MSTRDQPPRERPAPTSSLESLFLGEPTRAHVVAMSRRFDSASSLADDIALRLQIVPDPKARAGLAIVAAPEEGRRTVPLMRDVAEGLERVSALRGIAADVLVDAVLNDWLADQPAAWVGVEKRPSVAQDPKAGEGS